jgi:outer membrane protein
MVVFNNRVNDLIMRAVQSINADKKYKMVINSTAVLDFDKSLDITSLILAKVNELYNDEKKK